MKNYDAPSINIPSRGQRFVLARRNCPEVILPSGATQTAITPGSAWALGTRVNEVTATQFGNNPLILIGVEVLLSSTISLTTNSTVFIVEHGQIRLYKDNNLGTGDELIAEFPWYANASVNMSGNTDGVTAADVAPFPMLKIDLPHRLLPPYTLIRADATTENASPPSNRARVYPYFYTPSNYNLFEIPLSEYNADIGYDASGDLVKTRCFPSLGSVVTAQDTWVELKDELDANYLIEGWSWGKGTGAVASSEYDFAACPAGSLPALENLQAKGQYGRLLTTQRGAGNGRFFHPFIAYKGERLMVKMTGTAITMSVFLYGRRI